MLKLRILILFNSLFQKWQLFLAVICFVAGIVLVVIQKNNSDYRVDDFFASSSMNLGEAFYKHYYWPNYGVGMWSSVFVS